MKFRKKPVVIEAVKWNKFGDHPKVVQTYWDENGFRAGPDSPAAVNVYNCTKEPGIYTLEGWHLVRPGDWIITGVKGEHYPCRPDIFEMTYEQCDAGKVDDEDYDWAMQFKWHIYRRKTHACI